jgi:Tol biopolymer transport system component
MIRLGRSIAVAGTALAIAVAFGCGSAGGAAAKAVSPCGTVNVPAWSPDGTQIAWFGYRWPRPSNGHATGAYNILRAFCISDADGRNLHQVPRTVCAERCTNSLGDPPGQLNWVAPDLLVYGSDDGVHTMTIGQKPKLLTRSGPDLYSIDARGGRIATAKFAFGCSGCAGPVTIRSLPSGAVVGVVGGTKTNNDQPSLSPDGSQVVFTRTSDKNPGAKPSLWIASADGSSMRQLERNGIDPLWSPAGNRIAYLAATGAVQSAWKLVTPQGGTGTTLLRNGPGTVFGWSPNGRWIAFPDSKGRLAVIDVVTKKIRTLLKLSLPYSASSAAWSPNSRQLLVVWRPPAHSSCPSALWRVPISGATPQLVHSC